jgi:hypothetical protein
LFIALGLWSGFIWRQGQIPLFAADFSSYDFWFLPPLCCRFHHSVHVLSGGHLLTAPAHGLVFGFGLFGSSIAVCKQISFTIVWIIVGENRFCLESPDQRFFWYFHSGFIFTSARCLMNYP